ncbi:MAG: hypothetical protein IH947_07570 [Bacteroidetes bacterium]|nr:hypothetical protein [Bacteroidota bacterium]
MTRIKQRLLITVLTILIISPVSGQEKDTTYSVLSAFNYRPVGPTRGGRVTTVAGVASDPAVFYMGATGGGVWKTTDYGQSWKNISDGYFSTPSIGAIRVAPSNAKIIYAGTGSDGIRSNVITGKGVYKSTDAGKTWKFAGLKNAGQIGAVEVHPLHPDTVYVAAIGNAFGPNPERGVFRSYDGGESWEKVLFISDSTGASDLELAPDDPNTVYACMWRAERKPWTIISGSDKEGGIYKSTDGGSTWRKLTEGLPSGLFGKSDLAVSPANPQRVWALIEAPEGKGGVYRSDDRGESWHLISTKKELLDRPFYYCNIDTNPQNDSTLFVSATQFWKSTDGGKSWKSKSVPHGDNHGIWMNPADSLLFIQANDGGANVTRDGGKTWSTQRNQPTAELYQVEVDDQFPYWLYAGQQDNSTISIPSLPPYNAISGATAFWMAVGGCETGPAVPKPGNPDIVYSNCKGRFSVFNKKTGQEMQYYVGASNMYGHNPKDLKFRFQRVAPIHVSPHNPNVVYHASQYLHKTMNDGKSWEIISPDLTAFTSETQVISGSPITRDITGEEFYSAIYSVRESVLKKGLIWVGANDGPVSVTKDGGLTWEKVTPPDLAPGGRVQCVEPSSHKENKAYIAVYRYLLNDWHPYIYKTDNYGKTWSLLTTGENGIPEDNPVRVIREDPQQEGLLYAGTESGVYVSFNDGANWHPFQQNLPVTPVTDIKIHQNDLVLSTMGRGFWILDNITPLRQLKSPEIEATVLLYKPVDTYRMRYRSTGKNSVPHYPPPGVIIDFYLKDLPADNLKLTIYNNEGAIVRTIIKKEKKKDTKANGDNIATPIFSARPDPSLEIKAGPQRISWDLRHTKPWDSGKGRKSKGPVVAPGEYKIELTATDTTVTQTVRILIDPRTKAAGVTETDLKSQEQLALQIRNLLSETRQIAEKIKAKRATFAKKTEAGKASKRIQNEDRTLAALESELVTQQGRYMTPMLIDQLSYLYSMLDRADQMPGKDAFERYNELSGKFKSLKIDNDKLLGKISKK